MTFLERAKAVQLKTATETHCWVRLDLLEGLIAEIEALRDEVERRRIVSPESVAEITKGLVRRGVALEVSKGTGGER